MAAAPSMFKLPNQRPAASQLLASLHALLASLSLTTAKKGCAMASLLVSRSWWSYLEG
jgi:hypothetical protein